MTWSDATDWVNNLNTGGYTDWRLPTTTIRCFSLNCTESEMGHLFYKELSGRGGQSILSSGDPDLDLFTNIQPYYYWSTEFDRFTAWNFHFGFGSQPANGKENEFYTWAVRSGDVTAVPIPTTAWLYITGLITLLKRRNHDS